MMRSLRLHLVAALLLASASAAPVPPAVDVQAPHHALRAARAQAKTPAGRAALLQRPEIALAAAQARLADMVGAAALAELQSTQAGAEFLARLWQDQAALDAFTTAPPAPANPGACLLVWQRIDALDPASRSGLLQRLAIATALEHGVPVLPWSEWGDTSAATIDPVKRYAFYRDAHAAGTLFPCFDQLSVWELRRVVDIPLYDQDVAWYHTTLPKPELRTQDKISDAMWLVKYQDRNPKNGHSVQEGKPYYDGKRWTPAVILEYGGVCGAVAKFGSFAARAYGVPAQPVGQEGHCAMSWKQTNGQWQTGNCGPDAFAFSNLHGLWPGFTSRGCALPLYQAVAASPAFVQSFHAAQLATDGLSAGRPRRAALVDAADSCPANFALWRQAVTEAVADPGISIDEARDLALGAMQALAALAPQMALDLSAQLEQAPAWQALPLAQRVRWNQDLQAAFLAGRTAAGLGAEAANDDKGAWEELLGRLTLIYAGTSRPIGDFPLPMLQSVLAGKHSAATGWWTRASPAERGAWVDAMIAAAKRASGVPALSRIAAQSLVTRCMEDAALRARAAEALVAAGDASRKLGLGKDALELYRRAILAGEQAGDRAWVLRFTQEALKAP